MSNNTTPSSKKSPKLIQETAIQEVGKHVPKMYKDYLNISVDWIEAKNVLKNFWNA